MGSRTVVGQQSQDRDKDIRPSNNDVAGLSGGIKGARSRSVKEGYNFLVSYLDVICHSSY